MKGMTVEGKVVEGVVGKGMLVTGIIPISSTTFPSGPRVSPFAGMRRAFVGGEVERAVVGWE